MTQVVQLPEGGAVLVDEIGVLALETFPIMQRGLLIELGGRLNKEQTRWTGKFLMSIPQAAELIANIVVEAQKASPEFREILDEEIGKEKKRVVAEKG